MRGAPQVGFERDILRISSRIAWSTEGRPGLPARLLRVQNRLKPSRCQRITVAGWTIASACSQPLNSRDNVAHSPRSADPMRSLRLPTLRLRTPIW